MRKIVIIGPESTGKSTLSEQLAAHYKTVWCPEFAREFLLTKGKEYTFNDLMEIAVGQLTLEDQMLAKAVNGLYFIDTDMYVMKVWCEVAFNNCHAWILKQIAERKYDFYFLCDVDLPWVQDGLREYPDLSFRKKLLKIYTDVLINSGTQWTLISGNHSERFQTAVHVIDTVFQVKKK